jgi:hypothetical protein
MEVTYQLTADDFRRGMLAWRMRVGWRRWSYRVGLVLMPAVLTINAILLAVDPHSVLKRFEWVLLGGAAFWLAFVLASPWLSARAQFRRMPSAQGPTTLAVSDSGIRMQSVHVNSQIAWSAFIDWREEKSVFVVFPQPRAYVTIPKRAFSEPQQAEFRETLRRNILPLKGRPSHD